VLSRHQFRSEAVPRACSSCAGLGSPPVSDADQSGRSESRPGLSRPALRQANDRRRSYVFLLASEPSILLPHTCGLASRVRKLAASVGRSTACEEHGGGVGLPCEFSDLLPVILCELRDRSCREPWRARHPGVAHAVRIQNPGNCVPMRRSDQVFRKGRAEHLTDRERRGAVQRKHDDQRSYATYGKTEGSTSDSHNTR
jgi:hypothetical protein